MSICSHCQKELSDATIRKHLKEEVREIIQKMMGIHWRVQEECNPEKIQEKEYRAIRNKLIDMRQGSEMAQMCGCTQSKIASWLQCNAEEGVEETYEQWGDFHGHPCYRFSYPAVILFLEKNCEKIEDEKKAKNKCNYQERKALKNAFSECSFFCEKCEEEIEAMPDSTAVRGYKDGSLSLEEAKKLLLNAHIRHEHTNYDEIVSEKCENAWKVGKNMNYEDKMEMVQEARKEARRESHE